MKSLLKAMIKIVIKDIEVDEVDVKYSKNLHDLHSDLPFLPKRMKIGKCNKLVCNLYDKKTMLFI